MERLRNTQSRQPFTLILDWDGTMTMSDTTALIGIHCLAKARSLSQAAGQSSSKTLPQSMSHYSDAYMADYKAWQARQNSIQPETSRRTIDAELDHLNSLAAIEHASFARVRHAVLESPGMRDFVADQGRREAWMQMEGARTIRSDELRLRDPDGLRSLLRRAEEGGNDWGIVSVSWSRSFIAGALKEAGLLGDDDEEPLQRIWCNELTAPDGETGAGPHHRAVHTVVEKKAVFDDLMSSKSDPGTAMATCYVGDSTTDLACLTGASFGICMRDVATKDEDDKLGRVLERIGIDCQPLSTESRSEKSNDKKLYWATNFREIEQFLFS